MVRMGRPGLSLSQKQDLWDRWRLGQKLSEIGRALGKHAGSVHGVLAASGGIAPPKRKRSRRALTLSDREEISRGIAKGFSFRIIATFLCRPPSTISREVNRNGGRQRYRAVQADRNTWMRASRPKPCALATKPVLRMIVASKLSEQWSPEQVSGWLAEAYGDDDTMQISHETIYKSLFIQARGVLKKELMAHLRSNRKMRRARSWTSKGQPRGRISDAVSIRDRPEEIEDRNVLGHWEGDLISGSKNTHIATLVERKSRFVTLVRLNGKDTDTVVTALSKQIQNLPERLMRSLTWDRGGEMADHKKFTVATDVKVYFCDPQSPWQRGTNENTNRLLRQYLPKKTDLSKHSQADLDGIAQKLNTRPRKTLGFRTPAAILAEDVASTH